MDARPVAEPPAGPAAEQPADVPLPHLQGNLNLRGNVVITLGAATAAEAAETVRFARENRIPLLADIGSGRRTLPHDLMLMRDDLPDATTLLHVGGPVVSKRWLQWFDRHPPGHWIHLAGHGPPRDPLRRATEFLAGPISAHLGSLRTDGESDEAFFGAWQSVGRRVRDRLDEELDRTDRLTEPLLAWLLSRTLPTSHALLVGNSMPVRDMDSFGTWPVDRHVLVGANRGASGIDGLLATARGLAIGADRPVTALLGDLSALHDLNSLDLIARSSQPIVVIIVNNDGGGIFHFLPIASEREEFEPYFATPHGHRFDQVAKMFQLPYAAPVTREEFVAVYQQFCERQESAVIEVASDRQENVSEHERLLDLVRRS